MYSLEKLNLLFLAFVVMLGSSALASEYEVAHNHAHLHAEKGIAASELFPGYASLCDLEMVFRNVNVPREKRDSSPNRSKDNAGRGQARQREAIVPPEPMAVFDNFFFVGNQGVSAWLLGDEEGYILLDSMTTNEQAEDIVMAGIKKLGIDPAKIKHFLVTHAHGDHYGGHRYIKKTLGLDVTMSEVDWQLSKKMSDHPRFGPSPKNGIAVEDGDIIVAGNTELEVHVTPGHTMGTISPVFTVYDNGKPYRAALWGGTGFNFGVNPEQFAAYANSAQRFKKHAEEENVQVFFSNHGRRDGSIEKMQALKTRGAGDSHPFVMGKKALDVYEVLGQCAMAQYDRIVSGQYEADAK